MTGYLFYPTADAAQDRIWNDTVATWGEQQAESYIRGLHAHLQKLSETRALWRRLPNNLVIPADLRTLAYFSRYERHYVFFRELPSVMSILHDRMDAPARLAEDLATLTSHPIEE